MALGKIDNTEGRLGLTIVMSYLPARDGSEASNISRTNLPAATAGILRVTLTLVAVAVCTKFDSSTVTAAVPFSSPSVSTILHCILFTMEEAVIDAGMFVRETLTLNPEVEPDDGKRDNIAIGGGSKYFTEPAYSCEPSLGFTKTRTFPAPLVDVGIETKSLPVLQVMQSRW